jgi:hypothetical protein
MAEQDTKNNAQTKPSLNIQLMPVNNSDQPVLTNFTRISGAPGLVYLDFGFLEPSAMDAMTRLARTGGKIPERMAGKLAVRVALGLDTMTALHQQLGTALASLQATAAAGRMAAAKATDKAK